MKKLALAPAVAIAITGLAASPVIAAPTADTFSHSGVQTNSASDQSDSPGENEAQAIEASVSVSPEKISQSDIAAGGKGVQVTVNGLEAEDTVTDDISFENKDPMEAEGESLTYTINSTTDDPAKIKSGVVEFNVTVTRDGESEDVSAQFEVTEDDSDEPEAPEVDPKVTVDDTKVTASELKDEGIAIKGEGFTPDGKVVLVGGSTQSAFGTTEINADENGKASGTLKSETELEPGDYEVWAFDQEGEKTSEHVTVTVTEDEKTEDPTTPAAEAKLSVSPETISPSDFVDEKKGVTLAVENCEPGEDVKYVVNPKGESNVTAYENTVKADDEGKASVNVYGTSSDASAYIGDYDVTVTCGDAELTGEFSVSDDANAGGSDGNEDGNEDGSSDGNDDGNGGDLPRTGTELTGLVGGAGLLIIGGVAVALTMRRKKVAKDPSEI